MDHPTNPNALPLIMQSENISRQSKKYHASMAGEFFVAGQLQRLGIAASVTYGNAKKADLIAFSHQSERAVVIEVKTSTVGRWPIGARVPPSGAKLWVFVNLPAEPKEPPEFFVMNQAQIHEILTPVEKEYLRRYEEKHNEPYGDKPGVAAMTIRLASPYKDNWNTILDILNGVA